MIITIDFGTEFLPVEEEELLPPPWERKGWQLVRKRWPINLIFEMTNHQIRKPRNDMFGKVMSKGDRYFRILTCVMNHSTGRKYEIKDDGQTENKAFEQFETSDDFRWECDFFLWNIKAQDQWQTSSAFVRFYLGSRSWIRAKTCTDCGKTAREIGLYDRRGYFRWYIAWDKPGQYRCDKCHLVYAIFGTNPAEQPPN